jgi:hypothetical protein
MGSRKEETVKVQFKLGMLGCPIWGDPVPDLGRPGARFGETRCPIWGDQMPDLGRPKSQKYRSTTSYSPSGLFDYIATTHYDQ